MIKRMNKVTSLLVAAAAVVSLAPISGVNAAEKLETKTGTVDEAVAFDGGYIFDGYKTDSDATGVYYNTGDADKLVEDLNSDEMTQYGTKYAKVEDGSNIYLVDLTTGKIIDDTIEDVKDSVTTKLKSALNKTDRYGSIVTSDIGELKEIVSGQFAENWFEYDVTTSGNATLHGYVNEAGKYIDTDVTANIYVLNNGKMVKVQDFAKENKDAHVTVTLDTAKTKTIAEDKDYIYRIATVNVSTTDAAATYIQKISKAQGVTEDGAFIPNTVASYEITGAFGSENADKANTTFAALKGNDGEYTGVDFRVINGVVYATKTVTGKVTVTTFKLMKDKVAVDGASTSDPKVDTYLVEQDVNEDQTIMTAAGAVAIDVDGNTWAINKGEILKFNGTEFTTVYNCDRAMDSLNVYNQNNLIAWEDGQDVYAVVGKKVTETPVETPVTNKGWVKTASGWTFFKADGSQVKGQWVNDGGVWYMIKADGIMATGWYNDNGTWYFLNASGAMKTGWLNDNGTWYYLNGSGAMKTGWVNDNGTWYYLNASGAMLYNTVVDGYKLGASGAWVK